MRFKYGTYENFQFGDLEDKVFTKIEYTADPHQPDEIHFYTDTEHFVMHHSQDCCEDVQIESIVGDLHDLVGSPITMAELVTENKSDEKYDSSTTWSFYKLATAKGYVDIRWVGSSNGYYSEEVDFVRLK